jgi:uncharacterized protein (TIGR03435 family)
LEGRHRALGLDAAGIGLGLDVRAICLTLTLAISLEAQAVSGRRFDAASVKPSPASSAYSSRGGPGTGQISYMRHSLKSLLFSAFRVQFFQMETQPWMDAEYFDVVAKLPPGSTSDDLGAMMQNLLVERLGLRFHREIKGQPGFALRLGAAPPKIIESPPRAEEAPLARDSHGGLRFTRDKDGFIVAVPGSSIIIGGSPSADGISRITVARQSISAFAYYIGRILQQPVNDETGLKGIYDFHLSFAPPENAPLAEQTPAPRNSGDASEPAPYLPQAVEKQLGLKMVPQKIPIEIVVIDHVDRKPVENL